MTRRIGRMWIALCVLLLSGVLIVPEAQGFWFYCTWRDGLRAARVANAARANYHNLLSNSNNQQEIQGAKMAWDQLRNVTLNQIKQLAAQVPGTSLTGPTDAKSFAKQFVQEAVKEALGTISSNPNEGLPLAGIGTSSILPEGPSLGSDVMESVPVSLDDSQFTIDGFEVVTPGTYDDSQGPPPADFGLLNAVLVMRGSFFDVPVSDYEIGSALFGTELYTLEDLEDDLGTLSPAGGPMGERAFLGGMFDELTLGEAADNIAGFDPDRVILDQQLTMINIIGVDTEAGTIFGTFFTVTGVIPVLGDMNGDQILDAFDVSAFEVALADKGAYVGMFPGLNPDELGDFNGDGVLNAFDVALFEAALAGGEVFPSSATVPEPATLIALGIGGLVMMGRRR